MDLKTRQQAAGNRRQENIETKTKKRETLDVRRKSKGVRSKTRRQVKGGPLRSVPYLLMISTPERIKKTPISLTKVTCSAKKKDDTPRTRMKTSPDMTG